MTDFLRFIFSADDQSRISATSVTVDDIPYAAAPAVGAPYPQSMKLSFTMSDATKGAPRLRPLFPGQLTFIAESTAGMPDPNNMDLTAAAYGTWPTRGTLIVSSADKTNEDIVKLNSGLEVVPNLVWYSPVRIPQDFLFTSLAGVGGTAGLLKVPIVASASAAPIPINDQQRWPRHAIAGFLSGVYSPLLRPGAGAAHADVAQYPMPQVEMVGGKVTLMVTTALLQPPRDAPMVKLFASGGLTPASDPAHPAYGVVPARHVYRTLRDHLIDGDRGKAVPDAMLADWPSAPRYFALRFVRNWQLVPDCSLYFPQQTATLTDQTSNAKLLEQRLPAHGVLYLSQPPGNPPPAEPQVSVSVAGPSGHEMRHLDGNTARSWRNPAKTAPLNYDLAVTSAPYIVLRRRMSDHILAEEVAHPGTHHSCTYLSMRRAIRALVDNRIAGGRLSFGVGTTSGETRDLINSAVATLGNLLANNQPLPNADPETAAVIFQPMLSALFGPQPALPPQNPSPHDQGWIAYGLWQTQPDRFEDPQTQNLFDAQHIGRGGAGALRFLGLAGAYVSDPPSRNPGEDRGSYANRTQPAIMAGLEPGAILQFWQLVDEFQRIKDRGWTGGPALHFGHSMVFIRYAPGAPGGLVAIDQSGERTCPIVQRAAINTTLTQPLQANTSYGTIALAGLQDDVYQFHELVVRNAQGDKQIVVVRRYKKKSNQPVSVDVDLAANFSFPVGSTVTRPNYTTLQWMRTDIDVWIGANWAE